MVHFFYIKTGFSLLKQKKTKSKQYKKNSNVSVETTWPEAIYSHESINAISDDNEIQSEINRDKQKWKCKHRIMKWYERMVN